jgi:glycerophosphoryl diester phosphodiesterase
MTILTIKSEKPDRKLVGVQVPSRIHAYLSLYTLAKGTTKAVLFRELIMDWADGNRKVEKELDLVKEILERAKMQWKVISEIKPKSDLGKYKIELEKELVSRGVLRDYIDKIVNGVK